MSMLEIKMDFVEHFNVWRVSLYADGIAICYRDFEKEHEAYDLYKLGLNFVTEFRC